MDGMNTRKKNQKKGFYCVITDKMLDDDASFFNTDYFRGKTCWMKYGTNHVKYWREAFTLPDGVKISRSYGRVYDKK